MHGTRKPPSITVPLDWAKGVCPPSGQVNTSVPLSVVKTTIVLSSTPMSFSFCITKPMSSSSWAMPASSSDQPFSESRIFAYLSERCVTMCMRVGLSQQKNGLPSFWALSMKLKAKSRISYAVFCLKKKKSRDEALEGEVRVRVGTQGPLAHLSHQGTAGQPVGDPPTQHDAIE